MPTDQKAFIDALKSIRGDVTDRIPTYGGSLNSEEVIEWIEAITNRFELNKVPKNDRLRIAKGKLRGSALSWWNYIQGERIQNNKSMISSWEVMKAKIKAQFLPADHEVQLFRKLQILNQREMDMNTYTEEFHRLTLRTKKQEEEPEREARYLNSLRMNIQEETSLLALNTLGKFFQLALKVEEKLKRKGD